MNQAYRLVAEGGIVFSGLTQLVDFIDGHLIEEIHADDLAVSLGMTKYHLRRMFSSLAGMPLSGYLRRRRMTVAAADVLEKGELLAIAVRDGYGSIEAFSRAFRSVHGVGPGEVRRDGGPLRSFRCDNRSVGGEIDLALRSPHDQYP